VTQSQQKFVLTNQSVDQMVVAMGEINKERQDRQDYPRLSKLIQDYQGH